MINKSDSTAVSQLKSLKPIPGLDLSQEEPTQDVPAAKPKKETLENEKTQQESGTQSQYDQSRRSPVDETYLAKNVMKIATMTTIKGPNQEAEKSTMSAPNLTLRKEASRTLTIDQDSNDEDTVFEEVNCVRRPAVVKEKNLWIKKQKIEMTRKLPLGVQPGDMEAKKSNSHTGIPTRTMTSILQQTLMQKSSPTIMETCPKNVAVHLDSDKMRKEQKNQAKLIPAQIINQQKKKSRNSKPKRVRRKSAKAARSLFPPLKSRSEPNIVQEVRQHHPKNKN
uniref:Uncharacterized protein n=1 Tax=Panagrolaimus sp. JU765 TaxID=591449 RepID=A0AC34Q062_9BILA